jgi:hypothetical protein
MAAVVVVLALTQVQAWALASPVLAVLVAAVAVQTSTTLVALRFWLRLVVRTLAAVVAAVMEMGQTLKALLAALVALVS